MDHYLAGKKDGFRGTAGVNFLGSFEGEAPVLSGAGQQAAAKAIERSFDVAPVLIREGGSIPVVTTFRDLLGVDTLLLGWGQDTDNLHSPNERFSLEDFARGTRASAFLWEELAR